jgi:glutamate synthase (NADPH/NADH) small chain
MRALLESRLILVEDIQKVIEHAETSGERFVNQESGHSLAYFKPNIITYWVEYSRSGEAYNVHDAYSHRMDFEEGVGK